MLKNSKTSDSKNKNESGNILVKRKRKSYKTSLNEDAEDYDDESSSISSASP